MSGRQRGHGPGRGRGRGDAGLPYRIEMSNPNILEAHMPDSVGMNTRSVRLDVEMQIRMLHAVCSTTAICYTPEEASSVQKLSYHVANRLSSRNGRHDSRD